MLIFPHPRLSSLCTPCLLSCSCRNWKYMLVYYASNFGLFLVSNSLSHWALSLSFSFSEPLNQPIWYSLGRTDAEAETPILWPPDVKSWLIGKDPDAGKDWRQAEKGTTEDEMIGWHHRLDGHKFKQALGVGDGQGSLVCCNPWGRK